MHRRRDCADRGLQNHIISQFGPGVAALAVLMSSHMLQTIPHIVGPVPSVPRHGLTGCQSKKLTHQILLSTFLQEFGLVFLQVTIDLRRATRLIQVRSFMTMFFASVIMLRDRKSFSSVAFTSLVTSMNLSGDRAFILLNTLKQRWKFLKMKKRRKNAKIEK